MDRTLSNPSSRRTMIARLAHGQARAVGNGIFPCAMATTGRGGCLAFEQRTRLEFVICCCFEGVPVFAGVAVQHHAGQMRDAMSSVLRDSEMEQFTVMQDVWRIRPGRYVWYCVCVGNVGGEGERDSLTSSRTLTIVLHHFGIL